LGLLALVVGYAVGGAYVFMWLEKDLEDKEVIEYTLYTPIQVAREGPGGPRGKRDGSATIYAMQWIIN
jgi:hypothetical protein